MKGSISIIVGISAVPVGYLVAAIRARYTRSQGLSGVSLWR